MMLAVFLGCAFFCIYTYALFPLWLAWRVRHSVSDLSSADDAVAQGDKQIDEAEAQWPSVSVLIAAHNEEKHLPAKLASLAGIDYPADKIQVVIVSDGSSDATVAILEQSNVTYKHYVPAQGKPTALNEALQLATGEYLVYMDARQRISANALKALVRRFDDPSVGAVSGELMIAESDSDEPAIGGLYWRYEKWIRQNESKLFSTTGATGALYAIRTEDASILEQDVLLDDFEIPVRILARGKRTVFEPSAVAYDVKSNDGQHEFNRKSRTLAGNIQSFIRHPWLFNPFKNPVWWQLLSHKVFRLLIPVAMLGALIATALGEGAFLNAMFFLQLGFYVVGLGGLLLPSAPSNRLTSMIQVLLQLNLAVVFGAWRYFSGTYDVRWKSRV